MLRNIFWVGLGGVFGSLLRYGSDHIPALLSADPNLFLSTILVNMAGCFFLGLAIIRFHPNTTTETTIRLFLITGLLGSFTTFSVYTIHAIELLQSSFTLFFLYFFGQVFLGMFLFIAGSKISYSVIQSE